MNNKERYWSPWTPWIIFVAIIVIAAIWCNTMCHKSFFRGIAIKPAGTVVFVPDSPNNFIALVLPYALEIRRDYHIPASILIAQAANESGWGKYASGNNYLGLFRSYGRCEFDDIQDCFQYYAMRVSTERYNAAMAACNSYQYLVEIKRAGYAEDSGYVAKTWDIVERYNLTQYD